MYPTVTFAIPGQPMAKGRHRTRIQTGEDGRAIARTYTPAATANYENLVKVCCQQALNELDQPWNINGQFKLEIVAYFDRPKSRPREWSVLVDDQAILHTVKPDADNILKIIADGLNGIAWKDDSSVSQVRVIKCYTKAGAAPHVQVTITDTTDIRDRWSRK